MAIKTFTTGEVLTASDTNTFLANAGLVYVTQTAFTSASSVQVSNVWSSTYDNYRLMVEWLQNTTSGNLQLKLRDSGGDISTNYGFQTGGAFYNSGVGNFGGFNNSANETQGEMYIIGCVSGFRAGAWYDVVGPNLARETNFIGQAFASNMSATLTRGALTVSGRHNAATSCTGFSLIPSAGTITGTVRVYGYRQA